jgi:hypothetical protein
MVDRFWDVYKKKSVARPDVEICVKTLKTGKYT